MAVRRVITYICHKNWQPRCSFSQNIVQGLDILFKLFSKAAKQNEINKTILVRRYDATRFLTKTKHTFACLKTKYDCQIRSKVIVT